MILMMGRMAARAVTSGVSAATKNSEPPGKGKPPEYNSFAIAVAVGLIAVVAIASIAGGQLVAWITPVAVVIGLVLLGGMWVSAFSGDKAKVRRITDIPGNPNVVPSARELNEYYESLKAPAKEPEADLASMVEEAKRELASQPPREYKSLAMIFAEEEAKIRRKRVNDILHADCPTCATPADGFCTFQPGQSVVMLDEGIIVHSTRVSYALKTRTASLEDVKAQFEGRIPEDIIAGAL